MRSRHRKDLAITFPEMPPDPYSEDPYSWLYIIFRHLDIAEGYGVDSEGGVWSCRHFNRSRNPFKPWRRLSQSIINKGYPAVTLNVGGESRKYLVHHLVARAFLGPKPEGYEVRHVLNNNRLDARLVNLAYGTPAENAEDKRRHGTAQRGSQIGTAKLNEDEVREIRQLVGGGLSCRLAGMRYGVHQTTVDRIIRGARWAHLA